MSLLWKIAIGILVLLGFAVIPSYGQARDLGLAAGALGSHALASIFHVGTHPEQFEQGYDWRGPAEQK